MEVNTNNKAQNAINQPICCRQTRKGIAATKVRKINSNTKPIRQVEFANNGAAKKLINQANFTLESSLCSQVIGCSKYNPIGSDLNKSIF
jgi:hypothetical protein